MANTLSPSREAVDRTREEVLRRFERMPSYDDVRDMLAAAYAIDLAPPVDALQQIAAREPASIPGFPCTQGEAEAFYEVRELARAVLARSQEPKT